MRADPRAPFGDLAWPFLLLVPNFRPSQNVHLWWPHIRAYSTPYHASSEYWLL
ncbi:hypothetical protein HETIRDRAFT_439545 [Heterobasidion irregulare TC 32-1]|uniref:Uncharacterized protein n=1 Tax=Heterobasidion irregulare (strain TC 32-1) TaxID=747525 RepID=W4KB03_HETIT|nr:uncharacterized protein HETIRDRAFT_439545 [Heterobasidion irregulare TC 32-1]ETW82968.1 hypothetical protein HETIRDRAFT_439545 [Heterobasidion irregulare TC 32-1]